MRYTVDKTTDGMGNRYATGPLRMVDTDDLTEAQRYVHQHGGEVIDHETRAGWTPAGGWFNASDYLDSIED